MNYYEKYKPRMNELEAFNMVNLIFKGIKLDLFLALSRILLIFSRTNLSEKSFWGNLLFQNYISVIV